MSEEIKFEKAMEKLEKIVEDLENGNISLEDALKKYEEGVKLSRICQQRLTQAEKKIEILSKALDGSLKKEPFDADDFEESAEAAPSKITKTKTKTSSKPSAEDEESLF
jgi:exodeoxyribonuclease VII small subunit